MIQCWGFISKQSRQWGMGRGIDETRLAICAMVASLQDGSNDPHLLVFILLSNLLPRGIGMTLCSRRYCGNEGV